MERIEQILHRIQGIYYDDRSKTNIDIDLMLDYTRVLYADLLEWKKNVPKIEIIEKIADEDIDKQEEKEQDTNIENVDKEEEHEADWKVDEDQLQEEKWEEKEQSVVHKEKEVGQNDETEKTTPIEELGNSKKASNEETVFINESEESKSTNGNQEVKEHEEKDEPESDIILEPTEEPANIEETPDEFYFRERPILSFELPKSEEDFQEFPEKERETGENQLKEEHETNKEVAQESKADIDDISQKQDKPEELKIEEPVKEDNSETIKSETTKLDVFDLPPSNYSDLFSALQPNTDADIRKYIGLNDRYLFLNELFKNNKVAYDSCLDIINNASDLEEAHNLLVTIAAHNNWDKEDETVESFYNVISKHFSNK